MSIFGVQRHYFVSALATLPIDLLEGMGIVAMTERKQKKGFCGKNRSEPNMCLAN